MISINSLQLDDLAGKIKVNVKTTLYNKIIKLFVWNSKTFRDVDKAIDLSHLLSGISEIENFYIKAKDLQVEQITGLWFFEFQSNEARDNVTFGIVKNFILYNECLLDKLLKIDIDGCNPTTENRCNECVEDIFYINVLLTTLEEAIKYNYYKEAIRIIENLDDLCDICGTCPDYGTTIYKYEDFYSKPTELSPIPEFPTTPISEPIVSRPPVSKPPISEPIISKPDLHDDTVTIKYKPEEPELIASKEEVTKEVIEPIITPVEAKFEEKGIVTKKKEIIAKDDYVTLEFDGEKEIIAKDDYVTLEFDGEKEIIAKDDYVTLEFDGEKEIIAKDDYVTLEFDGEKEIIAKDDYVTLEFDGEKEIIAKDDYVTLEFDGEKEIIAKDDYVTLEFDGEKEIIAKDDYVTLEFDGEKEIIAKDDYVTLEFDGEKEIIAKDDYVTLEFDGEKEIIAKDDYVTLEFDDEKEIIAKEEVKKEVIAKEEVKKEVIEQTPFPQPVANDDTFNITVKL